ncbi:conserved hypothetical protein [uncultured Eubacteriales bacterium]|uniref:PhnB-like domain-containing protein n=1 Tax=uncultured Eubacteriales bacterium TaxID=172733 RepID=A0A212JEU1_9FIRM|nr:conserved hypothetical protein [uncultured Eubacteriales bacterium]
MQKIITNLWFDTQAEEAAKFYVSLFKNSAVSKTTYYGASGAKVSGMLEDSVLTVEYTLDGQGYIAINGGPVFAFTPAISLMVNCDTQEEVDRLWDAFCKEGEPGECGWLTDKFGLSWQIVPVELNQLLSDPDPVKAEKVNSAMLTMKKLDIAQLRKAYNS